MHSGQQDGSSVLRLNHALWEDRSLLPQEIFLFSAWDWSWFFELHKQIWRGREFILPELEEVTPLSRQLLNHSENHLPPSMLAMALLLLPSFPPFVAFT